MKLIGCLTLLHGLAFTVGKAVGCCLPLLGA